MKPPTVWLLDNNKQSIQVQRYQLNIAFAVLMNEPTTPLSCYSQSAQFHRFNVHTQIDSSNGNIHPFICLSIARWMYGGIRLNCGDKKTWKRITLIKLTRRINTEPIPQRVRPGAHGTPALFVTSEWNCYIQNVVIKSYRYLKVEGNEQKQQLVNC